MYPILVIVLGVWLSILMDGIASQNRDLVTLYQSRIKSDKTVKMAENIEQYVNETSSYPPDIATLNAAPGFEHTSSLIDSWQAYAVSPIITDTIWQFQRAVFISNDPSKGVNTATYLATNTCGTGTYATATSWCGQKTGNWYRSETRERFNKQISTQRVRMTRMLQKLTDYYNQYQAFPDKNASAVALGLNSTTTLSSLVAFAGSANTCTTSITYNYMTVPVDCADMYDIWGGAIGYQFVTTKHIILVAESPLFNSTGTRVIIAADFDNSLL